MSSSQTILILEKDSKLSDSLKTTLQKNNYNTICAKSINAAMNEVKADDSIIDIVLLDISIPKAQNFISTVSRMEKNIPILLTTYVTTNMEDIINALKLGAYDHLKKPINTEEMLLRLSRALDTISLKKEVTLLKKIHQGKKKSPTLIGVSPHIKGIVKMIEKIATSDAKTVLIVGDSGTGKELAANAIHYYSQRADKPYIIVNCAAIPETLLETELMGYVRGAFTDAKQDKKGLLEMADTGTLFLDEIGDMDMAMQAKLLRILEDRTFRRVGGTKDIKVDIRIVAATNAKLKEKIAEKTFREDLYYRLLVIPIYLPPLRERKEDIPVLIDFFIHRYNREFNKNVKGITTQARKILEHYDWPGNVRELKNVLERALILESHDQILPEDLPYELIMKGNATNMEVESRFVLPPEGISLIEIEKSLVKQALIAAKGKQVAAAKLLRMTRDAFRRRMQKYDFK